MGEKAKQAREKWFVDRKRDAERIGMQNTLSPEAKSLGVPNVTNNVGVNKSVIAPNSERFVSHKRRYIPLLSLFILPFIKNKESTSSQYILNFTLIFLAHRSSSKTL